MLLHTMRSFTRQTVSCETEISPHRLICSNTESMKVIAVVTSKFQPNAYMANGKNSFISTSLFSELHLSNHIYLSLSLSLSHFLYVLCFPSRVL